MKLTAAQQRIVDMLKAGNTIDNLSCGVNSSTLKALTRKGVISVKKQWNVTPECRVIEYQLTPDCAHCGDAPIADNGLYCQSCADEIGAAYMADWEKRVGA